MLLLVVALAGAALAAVTYLVFEKLGTRGVPPLVCRAVAWAAIGALLVNVSCPGVAVRETPIVLLDASLSMGAAAGRWVEAARAADSLGDVRGFGGTAPIDDSVPHFGQSSLAPALTAAAATGRPVIVVSDGEIDDLAAVPRDLLAKAGIRLFPRRDGADAAIVAVEAPRRAVKGDTITITADLRRIGGMPDSVTLALLDGAAVLQRRTISWRDDGARVMLRVPTGGLAAGARLLRLRREGPADAEPDTDERLLRVDLAETPGAVLLAAPGDWDARFLYRAVRDVAGIPVRGFVRIEPERWRDMRDLSPVSDQDVRRAAAGADLLFLKGAASSFAANSRARGVLTWASGENGEVQNAGDWYLADGGASPVAAALAGAPLDSFPPATAVAMLEPSPDSWIGLTAQEGRRGSPRPVLTGRIDGGVRRVVVGADGLFRWSFRGGSSEQAYRALIGSTIAWMLGGADTASGVAQPVRAVVQRGQPVMFEWRAGSAAVPTVVRYAGAGVTRTDTLRFDGAGRAESWLPPGEWRYTLDGGGAGLVAVERYSAELVPRPTVLDEQPAPAALAPRRTNAREMLWLFALALVALAGEWFARRRLGLR